MNACACAGCALWGEDSPPAGEQLLKELELVAQRRPFHEEELLFSAEDTCEKAIILRSGAVKLFHQDPKGKELIIWIASPGDILSLPRRKGEKFGINAAALTEGECCALSREKLCFLLRHFPSLGLFLLEKAQQLLSRSYSAVEKIGFLQAEERLAATLLELAQLAGERSQEGIVVEIPLNLNIIAGLSGVVPETAARIMARWKREGAISLKKKKLVLRTSSLFSEIPHSYQGSLSANIKKLITVIFHPLLKRYN